MRLIGAKSFVTEKYQDTVDRQSDRLSEQMYKEVKLHNQQAMKDVSAINKSEMPIIEANKKFEKDKNKKKLNKNKKRSKHKFLEEEAGLLIDLEG